MRKHLVLALGASLLFAPPALAQGVGPGPGPGPVPSPWLVNGNSISYPGSVLSSQSVPGGAKGNGTYNVGGGYYVNGVLVSGMPFTPQGQLLCNLGSGSLVPTACSWTAFASLAIGTIQNSFPFYSGTSWGTLTTGTSVLNPGTGTLESVLATQTVTGTSKAFLQADLFKDTRRSNSGASMADTFPPAGTAGLVSGTRIVYDNVDATAIATITAGSGTTMSNGMGSETVGPGRSIAYFYDAGATSWRRAYNTGTALLGPNNLSDLGNITTARNTLIPAGTILNSQLANPSTTVNGETCTLGGTCTIVAVAGSVTVGTTLVNGGAGLLYNTTSGGALSAASLINNGVAITSSGGVPQVSTTLPSGIAATNMALTTPTLGVATGTSLALGGATLGTNTLAVTGTSAFNGVTAVGVTNANAFAVGQAGAAPAFNVDTSTASSVTGVSVKSGATGAGASITATDSGTNTPLSINAKGTGAVTIGTVSTGGVTLGATTAPSYNKVAITAPATGSTLTIANGKTLTANSSLTLAGVDSKTLTVNNSITLAGTDGTTWTGPSVSATLAALNIADQLLTGGANVTPKALTTGSITVDCGASPLQTIIGATAAWSITAPANDGSCIIKLTNAASGAVIPSFSGFTVGANTGALLTTANGSIFMIQIGRVGGTSFYTVYANQ